MTEIVITPVDKQSGRFRRYAPVVGTGDVSPLVDVAPDLVHGGSNVVLLILGGQAQTLVNDKLLLSAPGSAPLPGLGDWRYEFGPPPAVYDLVSRLPVLVQLPVLRGILVWRVDYGPVKEWIFHDSHPQMSSNATIYGRQRVERPEALFLIVLRRKRMAISVGAQGRTCQSSF